jgi:cytochrome c oxidase subunit 3
MPMVEPIASAPPTSRWPLLATVALLLIAIGAVELIQGAPFFVLLILIGVALFAYMLHGWVRSVIAESAHHNDESERTFRWGAAWFIIAEVALFGALFTALLYARFLAVPWVGGAGDEDFTRQLLWPGFQPQWPLLQTPDAERFVTPLRTVKMWGTPLVITLVLLLSAYCITWAQWGVQRNKQKQLVNGVAATLLLGAVFLGLQGREFWLAYTEYNLQLDSGIYGATFYLLTGVHALHVTIGMIIVGVIARGLHQRASLRV